MCERARGETEGGGGRRWRRLDDGAIGRSGGRMATVWVRGARTEGCVPLPTEPDGSLALRTLQDSFPGCCGLTYIHPETEATRGLRLKDGYLYPPSEGWGCYKYLCNFPKENYIDNSTNKMIQKEATDLIVLGLPWKTTEQTVREYFESFGKVRKVWLKRDAKGQSKGFAFIRFVNYYTQMKVLAKKHVIDGRRCDVLIPHSKKGLPFKIFVGGCTENMTADDLREYFLKFGEVTDVFVPKPFRPFSFVTFLDPETAQIVCDESHIIKGVPVNVSIASPRHRQLPNNYEQSFSSAKENSPRERYDQFKLKSDSFNVDSLNFQSLRIGNGDYPSKDESGDIMFNKFATMDRNATTMMNFSLWDNYSSLPSSVEQNNFTFNDQGVLSNNSYNSGSYFPWVHPGSSSQWNHLQMSLNQQGHPL